MINPPPRLLLYGKAPTKYEQVFIGAPLVSPMSTATGDKRI